MIPAPAHHFTPDRSCLPGLPADQKAGLVCPHCGEPAHLEVADIWASGEFVLDACCEAALEDAHAALRDPATALELAEQLQIEDLIGHSLRRVADDGVQLLLDCHPEIRPVSWATAAAFVRRHHEHCAAPRGWRWGAALWNGAQMIGVVMVGRPTARAYDPTQVVEVTRLCLDRTISAALRWNACSMAYGWAAREAKRRGFSRIITYTLDREDGTSLKAAGWTPEARIRGRSWNCRSRPRADVAPPNDKTRWARQLVTRKASAVSNQERSAS